MRIRFIAGPLTILASMLILTGCGSGDGLNEIKGSVKLGGQPVESGAISFYPADGKTQTTGGEIKSGRYAVRVPTGEMKVAISAPVVTGKKKVYNTPNSPVMDVSKESIPDRYTTEKTELRYEVKPGSNDKDFDLEAK